MAISWIHPVRGVQALLSLVVLGLMAYGSLLPLSSSLLHQHSLSKSPSLTNPRSGIMVVLALAPILPLRSKLHDLRADMVPSRARPASRYPHALCAYAIFRRSEVRHARARGVDDAVLVRRVHCAGGVFE